MVVGHDDIVLVQLMTDTPNGFSDQPVVAETFRSQSPRDRSALVADRQKLILTPSDSLAELYDLNADPDEQRNLVADDPDTTASLTRVLRVRLAEAEARAAIPQEQTLTQEQRERLRVLGYAR